MCLRIGVCNCLLLLVAVFAEGNLNSACAQDRRVEQKVTAKSATKQLVEAQSQLAAGHYPEARSAFEAILQVTPLDPEARSGEIKVSVKLALAARSLGHMNESLSDLLRARKFVPDDPALLFDLGVLEDQMHLYSGADETLTKLLGMGQQNQPQALYAMARVKMDLQQLAPAETDMRAYLKIDPEDASAHYGLGRILQLGQRTEEARTEFERSIELQPKQTEAYYQLGQIELDLGHYDQALTFFEKTLTANPIHGGALTGAGIAEFRKRQYDSAASYLRLAVQNAPSYQPAHYYYGLTLARLGHKEDSERELQIATKMADEQNEREAQRQRLNRSTQTPAPQ